MKYFWHLRWLTPLILVGYVAFQAVFASGSLEARTDFKERTPYFDVLLPAGRVTRIKEGIILKQEPVYIDIRLPVRARQAALELKVASSSAPIKLGLEVGPDFNYEFAGKSAQTVAGLTLYRYDASDLNFIRPGHKVRFIISAPGLVPGSVMVKEATVSIKRAPATLAWWQQLVSELWR